MYVLVYLYAALTVITGMFCLATLIINSYTGRGITSLYCDADEFLLRHALMKYPHAEIETEKSQICDFFGRYTDRIKAGQEM